MEKIYREMLEKLKERILTSIIVLRNSREKIPISRENFLSFRNRRIEYSYYRQLYAYLLYIHSARDLTIDELSKISEMKATKNSFHNYIQVTRKRIEIGDKQIIEDLLKIKEIYKNNNGISRLQMDCELLWGQCYGTFLEEDKPEFYYALNKQYEQI